MQNNCEFHSFGQLTYFKRISSEQINKSKHEKGTLCSHELNSLEILYCFSFKFGSQNKIFICPN